MTLRRTGLPVITTFERSLTADAACSYVKHTLSALFDDGDAATAEFTVTEKTAPSPTPDPDDDNVNKQKGTTSATSAKGASPKTGDATGAATLALGILALVALCTGAFALIRRRAKRE